MTMLLQTFVQLNILLLATPGLVGCAGIPSHPYLLSQSVAIVFLCDQVSTHVNLATSKTKASVDSASLLQYCHNTNKKTIITRFETVDGASISGLRISSPPTTRAP